MNATTALKLLEATRNEFGPGRSAWKLAFLKTLARARLPRASTVLRLHEHLCFMRAHPDSAAVLGQVETMLKGFARRADLRRHRTALADSGIAGTDIHYAFYWPTLRWLAARWPGKLHIDWRNFIEPDRLAAALVQLASPLEAEWLRAARPSARAALKQMSGRRTAQGAFLVERVMQLPGNDKTRETFADAMEIPYRIEHAIGSNATNADTPSRTLAWHAQSPVSFITAPLQRKLPDLRVEMQRPPHGMRLASSAESRPLLDLAHSALVTRSRDIDGIAYGDDGDVWIVDDKNGLQWAMIGSRPERRAPLRATYGFLTLRNGVPTGYGQLDALFRTVDLSFNSYPTYRGAETSRVFARLLAACRAFLGATAFTLDTYQIGHQNPEAIASGAWWFYYRLGFRPRDPGLQSVAERELAIMRGDHAYRSPPATLRKLASGALVFETSGTRAPYWSRLARLGSLITPGYEGARDTSREVLRSLGLRKAPGRNADERRAWETWVPIIALLPVGRWNTAERRALVDVILAKGGRSERGYLQRFDAHPKLARALRALTGA